VVWTINLTKVRNDFMRLLQLFVTACIIAAPLFSVHSANPQPFFGLTPPSAEPVPFAADILTSEKHPHGQLSFSPDGQSLYWSAMLADGPEQTIFFSTFDGKVISKPMRAPFSADSGNGGPVFSLDGKRIFFTAEWPTGDSSAAKTGICYVEKTADGWTRPVAIESTVDTLMTKGQVTVARNGNIYFSGRVLSGRAPKIYVCEFVDGKYQAPRALAGPISSLPLCVDPWVDPNEEFMLVSCPPPSGSPMRTDIGISFQQTDGTWSLPVSAGATVNTDAFERFASITSDRKYLFFIRSTSQSFVGEGANYYWVDASILNSVKK
jgi:hypothetical protein